MLRLDPTKKHKLWEIAEGNDDCRESRNAEMVPKEYNPGWSEESEKLYEEFCEDRRQEITDEMLHRIDVA